MADAKSNAEEVQAFLNNAEVLYQPVHSASGEIIAILVGTNEVLDGLVAAIHVSNALVKRTRGNPTLN